MHSKFSGLTMRKTAWRHGLRLALTVVAVSARLGGQPSPRVPLGDPTYEALDVIVGSGLVRTIVYGQRPFTQREVARIIAEANVQAARRPVSVTTQRVLAKLTARFPTDSANVTPPRTTAAQFASIELLALDSPSRDIPPAPVGSVAADINPLLNNRGGRRYGAGPTLAVDAGGAWTLGDHVLLALQPRLAAGGNASARFADATVQGASVAVSARNLVFELGRQPIVWGQAMDGGLLFSSSGRPLDMIRIATARPWRAPWLFGWLGLLRGTALLADLGPNQNFPHAKIAAYKLSGQITSYFEFSAGVLVHEGGRGAPPASLVDRFVDLVPALKYTLPDHTTQFSNKLAGFDSRVRIPQLHGLQLYSEHVFDDMDPRRWRSTLWEDGGHIVGASLAQLGANGAVSVTTEFHHTGLRYYQHTPFTSGVTFNRTLLGDPLGPQGDGGYLRLAHDAGRKQRWRIDGAIERRGGDIWATASTGAREDFFHFVLVKQQPAEWRRRLTARWELSPNRWQRLTVEGGIERVRDAAFVGGAQRTNALAGVQWAWFVP